MNAYKSALSHYSIVKLQPSCNLKKICMRTQLQNFSLSHSLFSDLTKISNSQLNITGVDKISTLKPLSKKKKQLSIVEEKHTETVDNLKKGNIYYPYKDSRDRMKNILKNDLKFATNNIIKFLTNTTVKSLKPEIFKRHSDILIIGGGPVGLSIAYSLRKHFPFGPSVMVVDKDSCFPHETTNLGQGMISYQNFTDESEIIALQYGAEFFSSFFRHTEIEGHPLFNLPYDPLGSLVLVDDSNAEEILKRNKILKESGIPTQILSNKMLKEKFPWLKCDNILFGSLGMLNEGTIDPWSYLVGMKCKAMNLGVHFVTAEVVDFGYKGNDVIRAVCKLPNGSFNSIDFAYCIIAGGLESLNLVNLFNNSEHFNLGLRLPLEERMRYEYCFHSTDVPVLNSPIVFNSDGTYFRREGLTGHYVFGVPSVVDDEGEESEPHNIFQNKILPFLTDKFGNFKNLDLVQGWCEPYDFCISNQVGITGPHPENARIQFALGFSHHGYQLLPALGRAVMESIYYGEYQTLDFSSYHVENLWRKQHLEADERKRELLEAQERVALSE